MPPNNDVTIRINLGDWGSSLQDLETRLAASNAPNASAADAPYYCGTNK